MYCIVLYGPIHLKENRVFTGIRDHRFWQGISQSERAYHVSYIIYIYINIYIVLFKSLLMKWLTRLGSCIHFPSTQNLYSCSPSGSSMIAVNSCWLRKNRKILLILKAFTISGHVIAACFFCFHSPLLLSYFLSFNVLKEYYY